MACFSATSILLLFLGANSLNAQADEPFIQADVYNTLYEAYVECDENFVQLRSEFIIEKLEHDSGQITISSLKKYFVKISTLPTGQLLENRRNASLIFPKSLVDQPIQRIRREVSQRIKKSHIKS